MSEEKARQETTVDELNKVTIGGARKLEGRVILEEYSPKWPEMFNKIAKVVKETLGEIAVCVEHVGSTSVPGLSAKPIIDIVLEVPDSGDESSYVPKLESKGFELRIREPEWYEHRVLKLFDPLVNLHVFTKECEETTRMIAFRDHLRKDTSDLNLYESKKHELASKNWKYLQHYADAKSEVVKDIFSRIDEESFK